MQGKEYETADAADLFLRRRSIPFPIREAAGGLPLEGFAHIPIFNKKRLVATFVDTQVGAFPENPTEEEAMTLYEKFERWRRNCSEFWSGIGDKNARLNAFAASDLTILDATGYLKDQFDSAAKDLTSSLIGGHEYTIADADTRVILPLLKAFEIVVAKNGLAHSA